ncbi:MAG: HIT family protein [Deltaproteobacteria bacterium]|nr:HIT family protein [Deltaproteobacteria bacterium]MBW2416915.1 HIT family protein [Deltaproteobacteria bacterium]
MNVTAEKFGYPDAVVKEFDHWAVLVRPAQPTLGSLVLVCRDAASRFGDISQAAAAELQQATSAIERVLAEAFDYQKINYLMLMMVDPDVHFHVLPRYEEDREYAGAHFVDATWPGPPDITAANPFSAEVKAQLIADLRARFG